MRTALSISVMMFTLLTACESPLHRAVDYTGTIRFTPDPAKPNDYFSIPMNGLKSTTLEHHQSSPPAVITYSVRFSDDRGRGDINYRLISIENNIQDKIIIKKDGIYKGADKIIPEKNISDKIQRLMGGFGYSRTATIYYNSDSFAVHGFKFLQFSEIPSIKVGPDNKIVEINGKPLTSDKSPVFDVTDTERQITVARFSK